MKSHYILAFQLNQELIEGLVDECIEGRGMLGGVWREGLAAWRKGKGNPSQWLRSLRCTQLYAEMYATIRR
jgi:hypothetical protein